MKARVKATGEIGIVANIGLLFGCKGYRYQSDEVEIIDSYAEVDTDNDTDPDYWTRLEHQYAGMAMQGLSEKYFKEYRDYCAGFGDMDEDEAKGAMKDFANAMADVCYYFAHALVEKLKEKEERK